MRLIATTGIQGILKIMNMGSRWCMTEIILSFLFNNIHAFNEDRVTTIKKLKPQKLTSARKDVEKLESLCTASGKVKWCTKKSILLWKTVLWFLKTIKIRITI